MYKAVRLTNDQLQMIVDELGEANNAEIEYIEDPLNEVDDQERKELEQQIYERNELIAVLYKEIEYGG